jgi:nitrate reductase NapE component
MSVLESLDQTSNKAVNLGEEYLSKTQEYYELKVFKQLTATTAMFCKAAVVGGLGFLVINLLIVAGTLALGNLIGNMVYACLISAGILCGIGAIVYALRSRIENLIIRGMSKQFFN